MKTFLKLFYSTIVLFFSFAAQAQLVSVTGYVRDFVSGKAVELSLIHISPFELRAYQLVDEVIASLFYGGRENFLPVIFVSENEIHPL